MDGIMSEDTNNEKLRIFIVESVEYKNNIFPYTQKKSRFLQLYDLQSPLGNFQ